MISGVARRLMASLINSIELAPDHCERGWFGQPRGLTILFLTDMWEQFSYYGMRSILVYYMVSQLRVGQQHASVVYGLYTAFVYFTPVFGGLISDRWLGRGRAVILGSLIMALGHFMMAFEPLFYFALGTIALGNGLFLPSLPSQISGLYAADDPRRNTAYNYYYVGVNLGAFLAPLAVGTVGELYGWHWGFALAGIGMVLGLLIYLAGRRYLPVDAPIGSPQTSISPEPLSIGGTGKRFALLSGIAGCAVVFRTTYEQVGNTLPLWIEHAQRHLGSFEIPMTWFQSLNPLLIFLMTPPLVAHWVRRARQGREPSAIRKMATGATIVALSYLLLASVAAWSASHGTRASWVWLLGFFVVMTAGELCILPVGLGLFGLLAPKGYSATCIALWFFAAFAGNLLAGALGTLWSSVTPAPFFAIVGAVPLVAAAGLMAFDGPVRRASH
jgi:POT family proton-dependent oligopeptide transporter